MGRRRCVIEDRSCQKPDRQGGPDKFDLLLEILDSPP